MAPVRRGSQLAVLLVALVWLPAAARAADPIPSDPTASGIPAFEGRVATPRRLAAGEPPRHPFMAPNGRSNIHDDGHQSDSYWRAGPLGRNMEVRSTLQAADCASLGFKPKLTLRLLGGTRRGDNPRLQATLRPRPGDANLEQAQVTLPHSEFLDNEHIKTVCTRVQFAAGEVPGEKCPAASVYGYARAFTPLLDQPIQGPVFLRSSSHKLPDLVAALHSEKININLDGRIDSVEGGRIRNTFEEIPDAPVTKFVLTMQGGKKGLLINSTNLCKGKNRAKVAFDGQNGKVHRYNTVLKPQCGKKSKAGNRSKKKKRRAS